MTIVSSVTRPEPLLAGTEREVLWSMVDHYRATLLVKCEGLDGAQLAARSVPPSTLSLLGIVRHSTEVEQYWFERVFLGRETVPIYSTPEDRDADFNDLHPGRAAEDVDRFVAQCEVSREVARNHELDELGVNQRRGTAVALRFIAVHMVDEYARHCGHADLLREAIDGTTGD